MSSDNEKVKREPNNPVPRQDHSKNILNFGNLLIVIVLIGLVWFLIIIRNILGIFLAATIVSVVLTPPVQFLEKKRIPKFLAILLIYLVIFGIMATTITLLVPVVITQAWDIIHAYPDARADMFTMYDNFTLWLADYGIEIETESMFGRSSNGSTDMLNTAKDALKRGWAFILASASVITTMVSIPVIAFYFLKDGVVIRQTLMGLCPESWRPSTNELLGQLSKSIYDYLRGQILLCFAMFIITWPILELLGVKYALLLAVLAGIMEIIPIIGPTVALIPAVLIGIFGDYDSASFGVITGMEPIWRGVTVMLTYFAIQLSESNLLVPRIMGHTMDIHPVAVIFALLSGAVIAGIWGMLLALPVAAAVKVIFQYFYPSFIARIDKLISFE